MLRDAESAGSPWLQLAQGDGFSIVDVLFPIVDTTCTPLKSLTLLDETQNSATMLVNHLKPPELTVPWRALEMERGDELWTAKNRLLDGLKHAMPSIYPLRMVNGAIQGT